MAPPEQLRTPEKPLPTHQTDSTTPCAQGWPSIGTLIERMNFMRAGQVNIHVQQESNSKARPIADDLTRDQAKSGRYTPAETIPGVPKYTEHGAKRAKVMDQFEDVFQTPPQSPNSWHSLSPSSPGPPEPYRLTVTRRTRRPRDFPNMAQLTSSPGVERNSFHSQSLADAAAERRRQSTSSAHEAMMDAKIVDEAKQDDEIGSPARPGAAKEKMSPPRELEWRPWMWFGDGK